MTVEPDDGCSDDLAASVVLDDASCLSVEVGVWSCCEGLVVEDGACASAEEVCLCVATVAGFEVCSPCVASELARFAFPAVRLSSGSLGRAGLSDSAAASGGLG